MFPSDRKAVKDGTSDRGLWAEANEGGSTTKGKAECKPYDCRELLEFLSKHPETDSALIRAYIAKQAGKAK